MQKILKVTMVFLLLVFISSCEDEMVNNDDLNTTIEPPMPTALKDLKNRKTKLLNKNSDSSNVPMPSKLIFSWGFSDGSYFLRNGSYITKNSNEGKDIDTYSITYIDTNFIMATNIKNGGLIALPTWSINSMRTYFKHNENLGTWEVIEDVRYNIQTSEDNFNIRYSYVYTDKARFTWFVDSSSDFANYRYDVFLDGEKIEENYTHAFAGQYFHVFSLKEATTYKLKIVAKNQNNNGELKIKEFELKTPKKILISDFDVFISGITKTGFKVKWDTPKVTSRKQIKYDVHLSSNVRGSILGSTTNNEIVIDSLPISKEVSFKISVVASVKSDKKEELYYTEYKRQYAAPFKLLD